MNTLPLVKNGKSVVRICDLVGNNKNKTTYLWLLTWFGVTNKREALFISVHVTVHRDM